MSECVASSNRESMDCLGKWNVQERRSGPGVCTMGSNKETCVSTDEAKYRMVRLHLDQIDINLVEPDLVTHIEVC